MRSPLLFFHGPRDRTSGSLAEEGISHFDIFFIAGLKKRQKTLARHKGGLSRFNMKFAILYFIQINKSKTVHYNENFKNIPECAPEMYEVVCI